MTEAAAAVFGCGSGGVEDGGRVAASRIRVRRGGAVRRPCSCFDDAEFRARRPYPTPPSDVI